MMFISLAVVITLLIRVRLVDKLVLVVSFGTCESLSILIHTYHLFNHLHLAKGLILQTFQVHFGQYSTVQKS